MNISDFMKKLRLANGNKIAGCVVCAYLIMTFLCATSISSEKQTSIPVGGSERVDNWEIQVIRFTPDATRAIEKENMFNPKPSAGGQFAMAFIKANNIGTEKANFNTGNFHLEGASGQVYDTPWFVICPDGFPTGEAFPGATLSGNIAFDVAKQDIDSVKLYYQNGLWADKIYFDLP